MVLQVYNAHIMVRVTTQRDGHLLSRFRTRAHDVGCTKAGGEGRRLALCVMEPAFAAAMVAPVQKR